MIRSPSALRILAALCVVALSCGTSAWAAGVGMVELDDQALSATAGADGVATDIEIRINADGSGAPLSMLFNCTGKPNPCRMGLEFANRSGKWIVLKDYYGLMRLNSLRLDAAVTGSAPVYFDAARFANAAGTICLLTNAPAPCVQSNIQGKPAVAFSYPAKASPTTVSYTDMNWLLNIGRVSAEFDCSPAGVGPLNCATATVGYNRDASTGTAIGFRVADTPSSPVAAAIRIDGRVLMYGF